MRTLLLVMALAGPPAPHPLDRVLRQLERLECYDLALRRLEAAELELARLGRRRAGAAWLAARRGLSECRATAGAPAR